MRYSVAGVGMLTRKVGNSVSPVVELTKTNDDKYVLSSNSTFKNTSITFKLGEEFDEETPDGRKVKSIITQDGNKLLHTQKSDKLTTTIVREFKPDQLTMVKRKFSSPVLLFYTHRNMLKNRIILYNILTAYS